MCLWRFSVAQFLIKVSSWSSRGYKEAICQIWWSSVGNCSRDYWTKKRTDSLLYIRSQNHLLFQCCPTGGPRATSGPWPLPIQPATTVQKTLFTDLCFALISIYCLLLLLLLLLLLSVVNKLTMCWTEPVICKYSATAVGEPSSWNQSFNFSYSVFEQLIVIVG